MSDGRSFGVTAPQSSNGSTFLGYGEISESLRTTLFSVNSLMVTNIQDAETTYEDTYSLPGEEIIGFWAVTDNKTPQSFIFFGVLTRFRSLPYKALNVLCTLLIGQRFRRAQGASLMITLVLPNRTGVIILATMFKQHCYLHYFVNQTRRMTFRLGVTCGCHFELV